MSIKQKIKNKMLISDVTAEFKDCFTLLLLFLPVKFIRHITLQDFKTTQPRQQQHTYITGLKIYMV